MSRNEAGVMLTFGILFTLMGATLAFFQWGHVVGFLGIVLGILGCTMLILLNVVKVRDGTA